MYILKGIFFSQRFLNDIIIVSSLKESICLTSIMELFLMSECHKIVHVL